MLDAGQLWELLNQLKSLGIGAGALKLAQTLFRFRHDDIPPCHTRIVRTQRGLPWDEQIGVHPLEDGRIQLQPIRESETGDDDNGITRSEFFDALSRITRVGPEPGPASS